MADRLGLTRTDLVVLGLLGLRGPQTAGQLADATGLTTGAVTGVIDRLERAGYARRAPDQGDRRRVIVTLLPERLAPIVRLNTPLHTAVHALDREFPAAQRAAIAGYVQRAAGLFRAEALRLRGAASEDRPDAREPARDEATAPLEGVARGRLELTRGAARLKLDAAAPEGALFLARFEGTPPRLAVREGRVSVAYPRKPGWRKGGVHLSLSPAVPWDLELRGGLARLDANLGALILGHLEVRGGGSAVRLLLPVPRGTVPVRITGGASDVAVRRPPGVEVRLRVTGGATTLAFDAQRLGAVTGTVLLETPGFEAAVDRYDLEVSGGAAGLSVTAG